MVKTSMVETIGDRLSTFFLLFTRFKTLTNADQLLSALALKCGRRSFKQISSTMILSVESDGY